MFINFALAYAIVRFYNFNSYQKTFRIQRSRGFYLPSLKRFTTVPYNVLISFDFRMLIHLIADIDGTFRIASRNLMKYNTGDLKNQARLLSINDILYQYQQYDIVRINYIQIELFHSLNMQCYCVLPISQHKTLF